MAIENPSSPNLTLDQPNGLDQHFNDTNSQKQNIEKKDAALRNEESAFLELKQQEKDEWKKGEEAFSRNNAKEKQKQFEEAVAAENQPVEELVSDTAEDKQKYLESVAVVRLQKAITEKFTGTVQSQLDGEVRVHATVESDNSREPFVASIETDGSNQTSIPAENRQNLIINYSQAPTNNLGSSRDIGQVRVQIDNHNPETVSALEIPHEYRLENTGGNRWTDKQVDLWARALQTMYQEGQRLILPVDNLEIITSNHIEGLQSALGNSALNESHLSIRSGGGELHSLDSLRVTIAAEQRKNQPENSQPISESDPSDNSNVPTQAWRASSPDEPLSETKNESYNHESITADDKQHDESQKQPPSDNTTNSQEANESTIKEPANPQPKIPTKKSEEERKLHAEAAEEGIGIQKAENNDPHRPAWIGIKPVPKNNEQEKIVYPSEQPSETTAPGL